MSDQRDKSSAKSKKSKKVVRPTKTKELVAEISQLGRVYGQGSIKVVALDDINLKFYAGELVAIMGPSGSGKSTLLHCLAALDKPTTGQVSIGSIALGNLSDSAMAQTRRDYIGFIFQSFNLVPTLNVKENILLPLMIAGKQPDQAWFDNLVEVLELGSRLKHRPGELSGGQQQRVAAARALITKPKIILADEPTGNLDSKTASQLLKFFKYASIQYNQLFVIVTHDIDVACYAQKLVLLKDGQIVKRIDKPNRRLIRTGLDKIE